MATLGVSIIGASGTDRLSATRRLAFRATDMGRGVDLVLQGSQIRAESRSAGLDGYGRNAVADLRDFRSPVHLVAYKAPAGARSMRRVCRTDPISAAVFRLPPMLNLRDARWGRELR